MDFLDIKNNKKANAKFWYDKNVIFFYLTELQNMQTGGPGWNRTKILWNMFLVPLGAELERNLGPCTWKYRHKLFDKFLKWIHMFNLFSSFFR
jgi:hypothetical protein